MRAHQLLAAPQEDCCPRQVQLRAANILLQPANLQRLAAAHSLLYFTVLPAPALGDVLSVACGCRTAHSPCEKCSVMQQLQPGTGQRTCPGHAHDHQHDLRLKDNG